MPDNTFRFRLMLSLISALPSYAILFLIRGFDMGQMTLYGYAEYSVTVFLILLSLFEIHTLKVRYLDRILTWRSNTVRRLMTESLATLVFTPVVVTFFMMLLYEYLWEISIWNHVLVEYNLFALSFSFLIAGYVNADVIIREWKKSLIYTEVMEKENVKAHLSALQSQVSPHFLFNNFNVLSALIEEDARLAQRYLESLSKIFRYILQRSNDEVVSLRDELQFVEEYIFLLKIRFGDRIQCKVEEEALNGYKIPPVTLQILIENAVKHNEISSEHPLCISIRQMNARLEISNNIRLKNRNRKGSGIGLKNISERYHYLTDRKVHIERSQDQFRVTVPLLEE